MNTGLIVHPESVTQNIIYNNYFKRYFINVNVLFKILLETGGGSNPLTLLVAPLAAISLLAAAAAVALNPVLVSVSLTGKKRRKRSLFGFENDFDHSFSEDATRNARSLHEEDVKKSITPEVQAKIDEMQVSL